MQYLFGSLSCAAALVLTMCVCRPAEAAPAVSAEVKSAQFYPESAKFIFEIKCSGGVFEAELPGAFYDRNNPVRPVNPADIIDFRDVLHHRNKEWVPQQLQGMKDALDAKKSLIKSLNARKATLSQTVEMLGSVRPGEKAEGLDIIKYIKEAQELRKTAEDELAELDERIEREKLELGVMNGNIAQLVPEGRDCFIAVSGRVREGVESVLVEANLSSAAWWPRYVLNLDSATGKIKGRMMARVRQRSGIDYSGGLEFHTKNPDENVDMPELRPQRADIRKDQPRIYMNAARSSMKMAAVESDMLMEDALPMAAAEAPMPAGGRNGYDTPQIFRREQPEEPSVSTTLSDRVFSVKGVVPSHNRYTSLMLGEFDLQSSASFTLIPELSDSAWIVAEIDRPSDYLLSDARAELRIDDTPSGKMTVPEFANEKLRLSFGHAPQITSKRTPLVESSGSSWFGTSGTFAHGYKIEVTNAMNEDRVITVLDRMPISTNEKLKIETKKITPEPAERGDDNLLRWELTVPAGKTSVITVEYSMSYPSGHTVEYR